MSQTPNISMTPPLTPPHEVKGDDFGNDSLDYMDFFNTQMDDSPMKEVEEPLEQPVNCGLLLFSCKGEARWTESFSDTSCIGRRALLHLIQQKNPSSSISSDYTFYLPSTADNVQCNLEHYFLCVRQAVSELERGAQSNVCLSQSCHDAQYPKVREEVARFFNGLISHMVTCASGNACNENFVKTVIAEILDLLLYMRPLHDLPEHVTSSGSPRGNKCLSAAYHLLHLHLDIRWWSLTLLHIIESNWGCLSLPATHPRVSTVLVNEPLISSNLGMAALEEAPVFEQLISLVTWDLITVMCREGLKKSVSDLHQVAGFSCTCSLELGVMVLHLLDHRHSSIGKQTFWDHIKNKILILLKLHNESSNNVTSTTLEDSTSVERFDIIQYPAPITKGVKLPHIWWIFTNFSRLYTYDNLGKQVPPKSAEIKSETKLLRTLVKLSFMEPKNGSQPTEVELRFFVRSCLVLHNLWGGERSSEWASSLWDYFSKQLDSNFLLPGGGVEGLACMSKTAGGWLEQVKSRIPDPELIGKSESSWQIFLRIVVGVVQSGNFEWRQMRGRIYSKFHSRKVSELSPMGLYNSITLFLCLANTTDMVDVTDKLCELFYKKDLRANKSKVLWHGFLTAFLLLVESGCNITSVSEKFISLVTSGCQTYITSNDAMHKRDWGQVIILLADGIQEIFENSNDLTLGQHSLLCKGLGSVLQNGGISERNAILLAINSALNKVLSNAEKFHCLAARAGMDIIDTIGTEFGNFIKSKAALGTPPAILGPVAASLTFGLALYNQNNFDRNRESAAGLFTYFTNIEAVNVTFSQQYLHSLLSEPNCIRKLGQVYPDYEPRLVTNWLSALVTFGDTEELLALTSLITSLPGVSEVISKPHSCPFTTAKAFVKGIGKKFSDMNNLNERFEYRDEAVKYFSSLDKAFGALLKKLPLPEYLSSAMDLYASIIYYCHSVIYVKGQVKYPLPSLISTVILPPNVYSSQKPLNPTFLNALTLNMPKILRGLVFLFTTQDPYMSRTVKDIFIHYIHRFPIKTCKNYTTLTHPFTVCLNDDEIQEKSLHDLRVTFLEVVRDNYFEKTGVSSSHHQIVISLLLEILARKPDEWVTILTTVILHPLLVLLLAVEDQVTKRIATDFLQKLLLEAQEQNSPSRIELIKIIRKFVLQHISWSSHRLFRVLGVMGITCRPLLVDCLPDIAYAVRKTEEKRGTGLDHTLRQGYHNLLTSLSVNEDDIEEAR
ncbi:protein MMS22-like isoform X2 [Palaemon carinicauda]